MKILASPLQHHNNIPRHHHDQPSFQSGATLPYFVEHGELVLSGLDCLGLCQLFSIALSPASAAVPNIDPSHLGH
jgi:hypothetical protein